MAQSICKEKYYETINNVVQDVNSAEDRLSNLFYLRASRKIFDQFEILEGAKQIDLTIVFKSGKEDYKNSEITVNGYSYCLEDYRYNVENNEIAHTITKKNFKLDATAQMPVIDDPTDRHFLYKWISISMRNSIDETRELAFGIYNYHDLLRLRVEIEQKQDKGERFLDVVVRDQDYGFKMENFKNQEYAL